MVKKFKCIVITDQSDIPNQDPPFLNRFEKQLLNFKADLTNEEKRIAENVNYIFKQTFPKGAILLPLKKLILNYHIDGLFSIIFLMKTINSGPAIDEDQKFEKLQENVISMATGDFLLSLDYLSKKVQNREQENIQNLQRLYKRTHYNSLAEFLNSEVFK